MVTSPRLNARDELLRVRALYLDIAQWATEEPARWAQWAVPGPVSDTEIGRAKDLRRRKARMDQRTRERLPVLPVLTRTAAERKTATARRLQAALATPPGEIIEGTGGTLRRAVAPKANGRHVWAEDTGSGKRRNLSYEEEEAFWAFATIEVLRLTGIRCEELLELTHHGITEYRLPTTGELVPLLQIAPSKTDTERLLLVSPELADVLSAVISRLRGPRGDVPLTVSYDVRERVWNPPMPLLFQRSIGSENRAFTPSAIRKLLISALAATGLADAAGDPLMFSPHDFRRIFVTDAIMSGLPPHIAQVICGHKNIDTTIGYKAVYPAEAIEAHRAFVARRRATRPSEEYRTPTEEEWDAFLAHFEKRKVSVGTCARAFASPCVHEHACVRCSLLRPDPAQRGRSRRSATTCTTASPRPSVKAGSARSRASRSASPAPRTSSPRSTRPCNATSRPSTSACPRSPTSPAALSRPHRKEPRVHSELPPARRRAARLRPRHPSPRSRHQPAHRLRQLAAPRGFHQPLHHHRHQHQRRCHPARQH